MKLGFIGAGRMAEAVIRGLLSAKAVPKNNIIISDKDSSRLKQLSKRYKVKAAESNIVAASSSDIIILAVKPQTMHQVLAELSGKVRPDQLVISIAAGIMLKSLEKYIKKSPVVRVMPNNPCLVGEGVSLISTGTLAQEKDVKSAEKIFSSVGDTIRIDEKHMNAATSLSGSGPAFVYEIVNVLTDGGVEAGLTKDLAAELASKMMLGSIKTVIKTKKAPEELVAMVTSPGGTTIAGLRVLEEGKFKETLKKAIVQAAMRAKEIGEEFERSL